MTFGPLCPSPILPRLIAGDEGALSAALSPPVGCPMGLRPEAKGWPQELSVSNQACVLCSASNSGSDQGYASMKLDIRMLSLSGQRKS